MTTRNGKHRRSHTAAILLVAAMAVLSSVQVTSALMAAQAGDSSPGTCAFSLQLQQSSGARNRYVAKVVSVAGKGWGGEAATGNAVEEMYSNVKPASYSVDEYSGEQAEESSAAARLNFSKGETLSQVDSMSRDCICCHDGVGASSVNVDLRNNPSGHQSHINSFKTDHPIGMNYNSYVAAGNGYKRIGPDNLKMIFVDGKVGCLSCHDPLNPEKGHLVMSDRESALCRTCHKK